ncbi:MAG TPA: hypothetical protein HPP97_07390 [Desulfuromonadales bacterium]|nr:hypothetical protein [Desulfuromonadales bacterium]
MARKAAETSDILIKMYEEQFKNDSVELYQISWPQLRLISGLPKLDCDFIAALNLTLTKDSFALIPFDDYFIVAHESDFKHDRQVPDRIIEKYLESALDKEDEELVTDKEEHNDTSHRMAYQWRKRHRRELKNMSFNEVMAWFEQMEFREPMGHKLENDVDFQNLVMLAVKRR